MIPKAERHERPNKRQRTGVPGISVFQSRGNRRDGTCQRFLSVFTRTTDGRRRNTRICISTRGLEAAWRQAVSIRAAYERSLSANNPKTTTTQ